MRQKLSCCWVGSSSVRAVYEELSNTLAAIDEQEDLRWWRNAHGPGMPTDWPHFQVGVRSADPREQSRTRLSPTFVSCEGVEAREEEEQEREESGGE